MYLCEKFLIGVLDTMANFKLSDKLSILGDDKSDLFDLSVDIWQLSSSVILMNFSSLGFLQPI